MHASTPARSRAATAASGNAPDGSRSRAAAPAAISPSSARPAIAADLAGALMPAAPAPGPAHGRARRAARSAPPSRRSPRAGRRGPRPSCASTTAPSRTSGATAASIAAARSPRQSCVSADQPTTRRPRRRASGRVHAPSTPHGVRHCRGSTPSAAQRSEGAVEVAPADPRVELGVTHVRMGVDADGVTVVEHAAHERGVRGGARPEDAERRPRARTRERVEHGRGPAWVRAVVEGERERGHPPIGSRWWYARIGFGADRPGRDDGNLSAVALR